MTIQYQGVWTLSAAAQLQSTQRWVTDPLYKNTTLLLQADDAANGSQNNAFLDSSSNSFAITRNGNTTQGSFTPFSQAPGYWGNYFDGTGDFLTAAGANLALGTGNLTIEFWFYANAYSATADSSLMFDSRSGNDTTGFFIGPVFNNTQTLHVGQNASPIITANRTYPLNTWIHCAVVRSSGVITLYQDGVSVGSVANTTNNTATTNYIASGYWQPSGAGQMFNGYLSNLRISNTARYTANFIPPTNVFVSDANTRLLTCQSNRFFDGSSNTYTITPYGTPSVQAFSPFAPQFQWTPSVIGGSGYFDGTGDYLTGNGQLSSSTSMSTFTVEGWLYPTTLGNNFVIGDMDATGATNVLSIRTGNSGDLVLYWYDGAVKECYSPNGSLRVNQWNYFAIVVNSNAISMYINSTTAASLTGTTTLTNRTQTSNFAVGQINNAQNYPGYIGSLRWSNGIARTISAIPTAPYTSDANTRLLLNFTNAGIVDGTMKNNLETVGNAQVSTAVVKYGSGSMYFDGTDDRLSIPTNPNLDFGAGDFTIECWAYNTAWDTDQNQLFERGRFTVGKSYRGWMKATQIVFEVNLSGSATGAYTTITATITNNLGQWYHVAFVRQGGVFTIYRDGIALATATSTAAVFTTTEALSVGGAADGNNNIMMNGYIDDLRITKGIARYTQNFIPPSVALPRQ